MLECIYITMSKTIFFEGLGLVEGHFSGIGQYILGILKGLDEIIEQEILEGKKVPEVKVIIPRGTLPRFYSFKFKHIKPEVLPISFRWMARLWHRGLMPPLDLYCGPGHYVFTRFVTMNLAYSKSSVIIYDISFELFRQYSDEKNAAFLSKGTRRSLTKVENVFTISKSAKKEIKDFYKIPDSMIDIATPAADQRYFYRRSAEEISKVKEKYGIKKDYILALSNLEPRKNLDTLVDAYCALPESYRNKMSLLLVGVSGWKTDKLFSKIVSLVNEGYDIIRPMKYVADKDKPAIISGAKMLVYPSHYEGFGMPPLEALACGIPVITADNSSLPEVVGSNGKILNCMDTEGITSSIIEYYDNSNEIMSQAIIYGPKQATTFSWAKSAEVYWKYIMKRSI